MKAKHSVAANKLGPTTDSMCSMLDTLIVSFIGSSHYSCNKMPTESEYLIFLLFFSSLCFHMFFMHKLKKNGNKTTHSHSKVFKYNAFVTPLGFSYRCTRCLYETLWAARKPF